MDVKKLVRDGARVRACIKELPDGRLIALKELKIFIPTRFTERGLASVGIETTIVGIYAIVLDDAYYGVSTVNAKMRIEPTSTMKVMLDGDEYFQFTFEPGSTIVASVHLVKSNTLIYSIYDEIIAKGRAPWYLGYIELGKLFDTAKYHAGANIGGNHEVTELLVSMIARDPKNRHRYYRTAVKSFDDMQKSPPAMVPLKSVTYSATNTLNKLAGAYMHEGIVSALVTPTERVERIENLLRQ